MSVVKPRTMPGVMELLPLDQVAFNKMRDTIRDIYERFGFLPVETPVMELAKVLLTKSGGETERQVYFAQTSGSYKLGHRPKLALRFDLTVPLARYVAEHEGKLDFPFRRYQMQRVYRGESAQRGRFNEFYQCDIDIIGRNELDLASDAEIPVVIYHVFKALGVGKFTINISNRKIMFGLLQSIGITDSETATLVLREVDKLDKSTPETVADKLREAFSLDEEALGKIMGLTAIKPGDNQNAMAQLQSMTTDNPIFREGVDELAAVLRDIEASGVPDGYVAVNLAIARGLDYYTGTVYETLLDDHPGIGSVCSGGRYDDLAGHYSKAHLPGVGISIGATRLFYQLREAGLLSGTESTVTTLVTKLDANLAPQYLKLAAELRQAGLPTQVYHAGLRLPKQLKYAVRNGIRFAVIMGEDEYRKGTVTLKDLQASEQFEVRREDLATTIQERRS